MEIDDITTEYFMDLDEAEVPTKDACVDAAVLVPVRLRSMFVSVNGFIVVNLVVSCSISVAVLSVFFDALFS